MYDFDELWNYGDPAGTEQAFREVLAQTGPETDPEYRIQLLTQIGRALSLQRKFDKAHALLNDIEKMLTVETPVARIRYLLERGRTYNSSGEKEKALPLFEEAWVLSKQEQQDFFAVDAAHMVAIVLPGEQGLDWNMQAIAFAEKSPQPRARNWLGSLYNNTGWSYHDLGDYLQALDLFERALAFRREQGNEENIRIAKWCVGRCLRSLGRIEEALELQTALLAEAQAAGAPDGYTHEELGELKLLLGEAAKAQPHFKTAYDLLSQDPWLKENEAGRLERLKTLGYLED